MKKKNNRNKIVYIKLIIDISDEVGISLKESKKIVDFSLSILKPIKINKSTFEDLPMDINSSSLIDAETYSIHDSALDSKELNGKTITDENTLSYPNLLSKKDSVTDTSKVETSPLIPEWANQTDNPAFFQNLDIPTFLRKLGSNRPRQ